MRQLPLAVQLRATSVFSNYRRGPNGEAVDQLMALRPGTRPPAIWIYGPAAVGKTHLLQAVCAHASSCGQTAAYIPLADGTLPPAVLAGCEALNFVCIDDFERAGGRPDWQHAIFRLYTELEDGGGLLLIAADSPPSRFEFDLKDLGSRLSAGTVLRLQPLADEDQEAALTMRATQLGLELPADVAQFLLRRLPRDMATLSGALDILDRASLASQRRLTVPFVRDVLDAQKQ
jgi:DnaA-homolog protein